MASKSKHLDQYKRNKELAKNNQFIKDDNYDWNVIIGFYSALHCLESIFAEEQYHSSTHESRKKYMNSTRKYQNIIAIYENLEMLSRKARYNCVKIKKNKFEDAMENLKAIESFVGIEE